MFPDNILFLFIKRMSLPSRYELQIATAVEHTTEKEKKKTWQHWERQSKP
jgi:hypothetical protein